MSDSALAELLGPADLHAALPSKTRERADRADIDAEAFRSGDPECFRVVLNRFGPIIRSVVRSYAKNGDDQEDLYQEVSVRMLTQRSRYEDCGAMPGWITTVAHCACRNWCAARKARKSALDRYAAELIPHEESGALLDDPSRMLNYRRFLESLGRALAEMPARQAEAFKLVHIRGLSQAAAARIMDVSPATVRSNLRHARKRLRELLQEARDEMS